MNTSRLFRSRAAALAGTAAILGAGTLGLALLLGAGGDTTRHAWDLLYPDGTADPRITVVAIDEKSIASMGKWPWSTEDQARLVQAVADLGPTAIGYDVLTAGSATPRLERTLTEARAVTATAFGAVSPTGNRLLLAVDPVGGHVYDTTPHGHASVLADNDGVIRTMPLLLETEDGQFLPSFALRVADMIDGHEDQPILRANSVAIGNVDAPTEANAALRVHWSRGLEMTSQAFVSAADVLDGTVARSRLQGMIVLIGVTAPALGDLHVTPVQEGSTTPGVVVQAQVLDTILRTQWMTVTPPALSLLATALLGFAAALSALRFRIRETMAVLTVGLLAYWAVGFVVFSSGGYLVDLVRVPLSVILAAVIATGFRVLDEQRARREITDLFSRYVPERVAVELLRLQGSATATQGKRLRVAVLFCDLRGFTSLAEELEATKVRAILDAYYAFVCAEVFIRDGTVMQFVGDEVFAVFGAPLPRNDAIHAARSTAFSLMEHADLLRSALKTDSLPPVYFGIGLHAGEVVAAHIGPPERRQYAVVGDAVNVGSRLCGLADAGEIVVSKAAGGAGGWTGTTSAVVALRGKEEMVSITRFTPNRVTINDTAEKREQRLIDGPLINKGSEGPNGKDFDASSARSSDSFITQLGKRLINRRSGGSRKAR